MRLFIAIEIPEQARQQLEQIQAPNLGVRWSAPGTIHLTLQFIGNVDDDGRREALVEQLASVRESAFDLSIRGLGYFPSNKHPKILWAGVDDNPALMDLQKKVEGACKKVGFKPDGRPFTPHVTIGRVKDASKREVNAFINQHKQFAIKPFEVDEFVLFESKLDPDGARHEPLEHFGLLPQQSEQEA